MHWSNLIRGLQSTRASDSTDKGRVQIDGSFFLSQVRHLRFRYFTLIFVIPHIIPFILEREPVGFSVIKGKQSKRPCFLSFLIQNEDSVLPKNAGSTEYPHYRRLWGKHVCETCKHAGGRRQESAGD